MNVALYTDSAIITGDLAKVHNLHMDKSWTASVFFALYILRFTNHLVFHATEITGFSWLFCQYSDDMLSQHKKTFYKSILIFIIRI